MKDFAGFMDASISLLSFHFQLMEGSLSSKYFGPFPKKVFLYSFPKELFV